MCTTSIEADSGLPIRIITHNIRYATRRPFPGEKPWKDRCPGLVSQLLYHTRQCAESLVCLQEVLHAQLVDILTGLNQAADSTDSPEWSYVGVGRNDGKEAGEYSPILYRNSVWTLDRHLTMWLSETPWVAGSKGWDAASVRIVTMAALVHKSTGKSVLAMSTHLDDQGRVSRQESAKLIVRTVETLRADFDVDAVFLAGDLNSKVDGEAYLVLNETDSGFVDLRTAVPDRSQRYGNDMTFTGFNGNGDGEKRKTRIDFIHLGTDTGDGQKQRSLVEQSHAAKPWTVQGYAVLPNLFDDGIYISDHRAVVGDVVLN